MGCSFEDLPRRIFLDSSTLQTLQDYGGFIWENEAVEGIDRIHGVTEGLENIEALRKIFFVNQRSFFEFALSENTIREVQQKSDVSYLQWAYDVLDHWLICESETGGATPASVCFASKLDSNSFGYLGAGDRALIKSL